MRSIAQQHQRELAVLARLRQRGLAAQVLLEMLAPEQLARTVQALLVLPARRLDRLERSI